MRKRIFGRRFKKDTNQRKALFRSLMGSLIVHGKIRTTEAKAKAIKSEIEKLVTHAKVKGEEARNFLQRFLPNTTVLDKLISEIAPHYVSRPGGYTRIIRLGGRKKDNAPLVLLEWVQEEGIVLAGAKEEGAKTEKRQKAEKKSKQKKEIGEKL